MERTPYSKGEKLLVYVLSRSEYYRTGKEELGYEKRMKTRLRRDEIAEIVNELFHEGREVRSGKDISTLMVPHQIRKYLKSHPLQALQNQYVRQNQKA